jgi:oligopeptide/dipeptide ABC transporter ATP-binding protein
VPSLRGKELRSYRRTGIAIIHQNPRSHINPVRTIGDFMTEALIASGEAHKAAEERVVVALADVGIPDGARRLRQYPHQLSGGLLQRVMIATAVVAQPRLLIADEPTSALDVTTQEEVMAIINDQRREHGLAMLFISHDLELTAAVTDRIAVMYAGMLVEDTPTEMLHAPLHPYTAGLLAARPSVRESRRLWAIPGRPMSAFEVGRGCVFAARCPFAMDKCRAERPRLLPLAGHFVACHRAEELQGQLTYETMTRP